MVNVDLEDEKMEQEFKIKNFIENEAISLPCLFCWSKDIAASGFFIPLTATPVDGKISQNRVYGYSICANCAICTEEESKYMQNEAEKRIIRNERTIIIPLSI